MADDERGTGVLLRQDGESAGATSGIAERPAGPAQPLGAAVWATLFEGLPVATLVLDAASRVIVANRAARSLFDAAEARMSGYAARRFLDADLLDQAWLSARAHGGIHTYRELISVAGIDLQILVQASRLELDGGEFLVLSLRDRTAERRERAEWTSQQAPSDLVHRSEPPVALLNRAQHFEVLGHLIGTLAHDFKNLMTVILTSLEGAKRRLADGADATVDLDRASLAAERSVSMTREVLSYSRGRDLPTLGVDPASVVSGLAGLLERALGGVAELVSRTEPGPSVQVEASQLETAILNLVINARDAIVRDGRVGIECRPRQVDDAEAGGLGLRPGQYVSIVVQDNGMGMTPETRAKAFDPFFTTKPEGEGTGLGLSTVRAFARRAGGAVGLSSEPNQGTRVELLLPPISD